MADITDPAIITYNNDYMRPLAEVLRNAQIAITDAKTEYQATIQGLLTPYADGDVLVDGRASAGVYQVTKLDITDLITQLSNVLTQLDIVGADTLRAKFTVRPPSIG